MMIQLVHLKKVPKKSQIPLAENLIPIIDDVCETQSKFTLWYLLIPSLSRFLEKPPRGGKRQKSLLSSNIIRVYSGRWLG